MNATALAIVSGDELDTIQRTGRLLANSGYFDGKGDTAQAIAMMATKILAGREMGFGPFASVNGVHIISGKPSIGANLMAAAVKGHPNYDYRVQAMTNTECTLEFFERGESIGVSTFTMQDAQSAQVTNNPTWKKFPRNMLFARALSNGVRWYCPDVFAGNAVYVPEELGAEVDGDGNVVDTTYTVTEPPAPVEPEVEFDKPRITDNQREQLYGIVREFYGPDEWEEQMIKLTKAVTKNKTDNPDNLLASEAARLIDGVQRKMAQVAAMQAA